MTQKLEDISDTAHWVAHYRAVETEREDALFKDPYAKLLSGKRGQEVRNQVDRWGHFGWFVSMRTKILDDLIVQTVSSHGVDTVLNLAAGLDTRPFRLNLPRHLNWVEVDFP